MENFATAIYLKIGNLGNAGKNILFSQENVPNSDFSVQVKLCLNINSKHTLPRNKTLAFLVSGGK